MIIRCVFAILGSVLLASCVSKEPSHGGDYKILAARPTPRDWRAGVVWTFVTAKRSGERDVLTFRVTHEIAKTCTSGTWRRLQIVSGHVPQEGDVVPQPAFMIDGSFLWIDVNAPWCDADDYIRGRLEGDTFTGDRTVGGPMGSDLVGPVQGRRVK
jgi:hypothetical protein